MTDEIDNEEAAMIAAEYALGLLTPQEAAAFEAVIGEDPALRLAYAQWAESFASMTDEISPVEPSAHLLPQILKHVDAPTVDDDAFLTVVVNPLGPQGDLPEALVPNDQLAEGQGPAATPGEQGPSWLQRLGLLPAMGAGLAAAMLVLWLVNVSGLLGPSEPVATAALVSEDQSLVVQITYADNNETLQVTRSAGAAPAGQVLELWLLKEGADPVSLGVLPEAESGTLQVAEALRPLLHGADCAISVEPPGGSPTGTPTGPVLAVAPIVWDT